MEIDDDFNIRVELFAKQKQPKQPPVCQVKYGKLPSGNEVKVSEVLIENLYFEISLCQMRNIDQMQIGDTFSSPSLGKVLFSRSAEFDEGDFVYGDLYWEKYQIANDSKLIKCSKNIEDALKLFGSKELKFAKDLIQMINPKENETIAVVNAASSLGQAVMQALETKQCNVIGLVEYEPQIKFLVQKFPTYTRSLQNYDGKIDIVVQYSTQNLIKDIIGKLNQNSRLFYITPITEQEAKDLSKIQAEIQAKNIVIKEAINQQQIKEMGKSNINAMKPQIFLGLDISQRAMLQVWGEEPLVPVIVKVSRVQNNSQLQNMKPKL